MPRSIAVAQTSPKPGDVDYNVQEHLELVARARTLGAEVLVFPELSLTGYELEAAKELAFVPDDARIEPLVEAASEASMTLLLGAPLRLETGLHIGAFIINADAAVDLYTKQHLGTFPSSARADGRVPPPEASVFVPGSSAPLVTLGSGLAAPAICADTSCASHPEDAANRGANAYLVGMFVIPDELEAIRVRMAGYARRHEMTVALANYGGPSAGCAAAGSSAIWSPHGDRLVELPASGRGIALARYDGLGWETQRVTC